MLLHAVPIKSKSTVPLLLVATVIIGVVAGYFMGHFAGLSQQRETIVLAIQPTEAVLEISPRAAELEKFLEDHTGLDIRIFIPTTYAGVIEALRFGTAHVAMMSAWPLLLANKMAGAELGLAEIREVVIGQDKQEAPFYFSNWVVLKDSQYHSLIELKGKKVCFPSPLSTSGYVFPMSKLVELGYIPKSSGEPDPKMFFSEAIFAGGYAQCWTALKAGQVDVTIIAGDVSEKLYWEVLAATRILERQGPIPSHGVVFAKNLNVEVKAKLIRAFLELGKPEFRDLMRKLVSGIFVRFEIRTTEEHLSGLRKAIELTGLRFTERLG